MKPKIIRMNPFPFDLIVFFGTEKNKLFKWLKKEIPEQIVASPDVFTFNGKWRTIRTDGGWIILWTETKEDQFLIHELFHVCEMLFDKVGIEHNLESGELWAYMQQFLFNEIKKCDF